jgi:hypothetical protein
MRNRLLRLHRDERGMSFVYVGVGFMGFLAATTLAIDVGMFMTARTQAQTAADAGALAGAVALVMDSWDDRSASGPAVQSAINTAQPNKIMSGTPSVVPSDVTFPTSPSGEKDRVRVQVYRTKARSNALPTLMGQLFGVKTADIVAVATAEASPANAATCVKPFMIPDRWKENQDPKFDPLTSTYDRYDNKGNLLKNPDVYVPAGQPGYTGYTIADRGTLMILRAGTGSNISPSMYYSWKMPSDIGGDYYRNNISGCNTTVLSFSPTKPYYMIQEPGDMSGPTNQGIDDLIAKDPGATWDTSCKCVKGSKFGVSPRVTPLPLFDPEYYATGKANGRTADFKLANVMGYFIDKRVGNQVYGYITPLTGIFDPNAGPAPAGAFPRAIRLVE